MYTVWIARPAPPCQIEASQVAWGLSALVQLWPLFSVRSWGICGDLYVKATCSGQLRPGSTGQLSYRSIPSSLEPCARKRFERIPHKQIYFLPRSIFCRAHSTRSCQQSGSLRHSRSATPHIACSTDAAPSPTGKPRSRQLCNPHGQGAGALGRETRAGGACGQRSRVPGEEKQVATCLHVRPRLATPTTGMYNAMRSCQEVPGTLNLDPGALC